MISDQSAAGRYFTTAEAARRLRRCTKTLERLRQSAGGPRFLQFGRKVLYAEAALMEFEAAHTTSSRPQPMRSEEIAA